jgi:hypothetical protein
MKTAFQNAIFFFHSREVLTREVDNAGQTLRSEA